MSYITKNYSIWEEEPPSKRRTCMLMITHACNLNCSYCYETHKHNTYMSVNQAKKLIEQEAQLVMSDERFNEIQIDFMGGEPMMNFPLIREIVEWLEDGAISVPWICFASTNATLLTDAVKDWLRLHKESIILSASYDGSMKMQSTNRGTDKYSIALDFFHELWPEQTFQMTISKDTLASLAEGVLYIQRKGYDVSASLAQGVEWTKEDAILYREQLCILKEAYISDLKLKPFNRLIRVLDLFRVESADRVQVQGCGTGTHMVTYDIDGNRYGCHMFSPIVLGSEYALLTDSVEWEKPNLMADDYCKECVLRMFCPTCPGFNYKYRGDFAKRDKRWCPLVLVEAITACEFQIERLSKMDKLDKIDAEYGKAAVTAYNILKDIDINTAQSPYMIQH